jgi:hypothetical protein
MVSAFFLDITQHRVVIPNDISGKPFGLIFKDQEVLTLRCVMSQNSADLNAKHFPTFYVHVTVHRNKFLFNKTNRRTNFPHLFCQETLHVSGSSSAHYWKFPTVHSALVYVMQVWWQLSSTTRMELSSLILTDLRHLMFSRSTNPEPLQFEAARSLKTSGNTQRCNVAFQKPDIHTTNRLLLVMSTDTGCWYLKGGKWLFYIKFRLTLACKRLKANSLT